VSDEAGGSNMSGRTHSTGLAFCALAASSVLAFAQDPGNKGGHQEEAKPNSGQSSSNGPPPTIHMGRFLLGDGAPDIEGRDQANARYHLAEERRDKSQMIVFAARRLKSRASTRCRRSWQTSASA